MSLKKAIEQIKKHKIFLISTHINPEADGIGAELAFLSLLKKMGKRGFIVNESRLPAECAFLPGAGALQSLSHQKISAFDCVVFMDCSEASRAGKVAQMNLKNKPTLNIDHHISNTRFASVNWVELKASSTCEMVHRLYQKLKVTIDADIALMLYAGMAVDTGSFRYSNTSAQTHRIAASFIDKGVRPAHVYHRLFENNSFSDIQLLGRILLTIKRNAQGKIAWALILRHALKHVYPSIDLAESVLNLLRSIREVELAIIFKESRGKKNQFRVNFRSQTNFDCNYLASCFGGGGHKNAGGATITGNLPEIKNKVLKRAKELMNTFLQENSLRR